MRRLLSSFGTRLNETRTRPQHGFELDLDVDQSVLSNEVVHALMDEWLVPAMVDEILRDLMNPTSVK